MAVSGVRISWLIFERKKDLASDASTAFLRDSLAALMAAFKLHVKIVMAKKVIPRISAFQ
jgi:hypothetical protein